MGTTTPTAAEIAAIRADLTTIATSFSDGEITTYWGRVSSASTAFVQSQAVCALMVRAAMANAALKTDYDAGNTSEKLSQRMASLQKLYALYAAALDKVLNVPGSQVVIGSMRRGGPVAERPVDYSYDGDNPTTITFTTDI